MRTSCASQPARTLVAALQRLLFAVALRADSPRLLLAGGRVDLTRLDVACQAGGGSAMPLPRAGTGGMVQYLDPSEPASRASLERSALFAPKASPEVGVRFEAQGWAWRESGEMSSVQKHEKQCGLASGCYLFPGATVGSGGIEHLWTTDAAGCCDACSRCLAWTFHKDPQGPPRTATSRARNRATATGAPTKSRPDEQHPVRSHRRGIDLLRRDGGGAQPAAASRWGHLGQRFANATQTLFAEFAGAM